MSRSTYSGPKLPKFLLDQVGGGSKVRKDVSRKDRRKAERAEKKSARSSRPVQKLDRATQRAQVEESDADDDVFDDEASPEPRPPPKKLAKEAKPVKSILKATKKRDPESKELEDIDGLDGEADDSDGSFTISRHAAKAGMASEEDEIAALERKLGVRSKKRSMEVGDDELDWLVTGSDSETEGRGTKRKRPDDAKWLRDKRLKANDEVHAEDSEESEGEEDMDELEDDEEDEEELENPFSEDELSEGDFEGFESDGGGDEDAEAPVQKPTHENPYVAPVSKDTTPSAGKYIPPSLRKAAASDDEALKQLRRQIQGQLNRLSEANMLSILAAIEQIYVNNARQHVTSTLVDLLIGLANDPSTLNDTFIILHAGFAAAIYKVVGTDFGAQLLEKLVETFDHHRNDSSAEGKQTLNLIAFLSCLYAFQVVGSAIVFDYIRLLLEEISETNTELLLRIIRSSGTQLRQDDPTALKDIVMLLQRNVADAGGEAVLSVRQKFMMETINNLKNNRMKAGAAASAMTAEHTTRMRKTLGSLNTRSNLKATEPLRITLADIRDSEKKGKWWLVGASYHDPAKLAANGAGTKSSSAFKQDDVDAGYESETPGHVNFHKLARQQGMNTDIRRAIFISILSASDYKDAHMRLLKLHLKSKQELEIPRVLLHCVGAEQVYNPYYTLIARKVCSQDNKMRKAFQFALWDVFRQLGESGDADDSPDEDGGQEEMGTKKIVNLAKLYGSLVAEAGLSIAVLKTLEFAYMQPKTSMFVEVLLTTVILQAHKKTSKDADAFEGTVRDLFMQAQDAANLVQGLQYFVQTVLSKAALANGKREAKTVKEGCKVALGALAEAAQGAPMADDESDQSDGSN